MAELSLIRGYDPIFRKKASVVESFDQTLRETVERLYDVLYDAGGIGLGANMVGLLQRIAIVDLQPGGVRCPLTLVNPQITWLSDEKQIHSEASLCFPGLSAEVTRPAKNPNALLRCRWGSEGNGCRGLAGAGYPTRGRLPGRHHISGQAVPCKAEPVIA